MIARGTGPTEKGQGELTLDRRGGLCILGRPSRAPYLQRLAAQRKLIESYAERNGMQIVQWFEDRGISGKRAKRPALDRLGVASLSCPGWGKSSGAGR